MKSTFTAVVVKEGKFYVSHCPELGVPSQGMSLDEGIDDLKDAVSLYLKDEEIGSTGLASEDMHRVLTTVEVCLMEHS